MVRNQIPAIVLYLLIVQLLGCDSSPNGGDNETEEGVEILFNGDVESGRFQADGWTFFSSSVLFVKGRWTTLESVSPSHALSIVLSRAIGTPSHWSQGISIDSTFIGKTVKFSAKIKLDQVQGQGAILVFRANGVEGQLLDLASTEVEIEINGTDDWKTYSTQMLDLPKGTESIRAFLLVAPNTTGTVYFDDTSLKVLD